eukprot:g6526.t1
MSRTRVYYHIPADGDEEDHPNVVSVSHPIDGLRLGHLKKAFPVPGSYHFRCKLKWKNTFVWLDVIDDNGILPNFEGRVSVKATRFKRGIGGNKNVDVSSSSKYTGRNKKTTHGKKRASGTSANDGPEDLNLNGRNSANSRRANNGLAEASSHKKLVRKDTDEMFAGFEGAENDPAPSREEETEELSGMLGMPLSGEEDGDSGRNTDNLLELDSSMNLGDMDSPREREEVVARKKRILDLRSFNNSGILNTDANTVTPLFQLVKLNELSNVMNNLQRSVLASGSTSRNTFRTNGLSIRSAAIAGRTLVILTSTSHILRWNLGVWGQQGDRQSPPDCLPPVSVSIKSPRSVVRAIFVDPTGNHVLIAADGHTFYLHSSSDQAVVLKTKKKMKNNFIGQRITAVGWNRYYATESETGPFLLGTESGAILETELSADVNTVKRNGVHCSLLMQLRKEESISGLHVELFPGMSATFSERETENIKVSKSTKMSFTERAKAAFTGSTLSSSLSSAGSGKIISDGKWFVMVSTRRRTGTMGSSHSLRYYEFIGGPDFVSLFSEYNDNEYNDTDKKEEEEKGKENEEDNIVIGNNRKGGLSSSSSSSSSPLQFTEISSKKKGFGEIIATSSSPLSVVCPHGGMAKAFVLETNDGFTYGRFAFGSQHAGERLITDQGQITFESTSKRRKEHKVALSQFHYLLLRENETNDHSFVVQAMSRLSEEIVFEQTFASFNNYNHMNNYKTVMSDSTTGEIWVVSNENIWLLQMKNESSDIWKEYLTIAMSGEECEFGSALRWCPSNRERHIVNREHSEYLFELGQLEMAARKLSDAGCAVEDVILRFMVQKKNAVFALESYLQDYLLSLSSNQTSQRTVLLTWMLEIYLYRIHISFEESEKNDAVSSLNEFLRENFVDLDIRSSLEALGNYGRTNEMLYFAEKCGQWRRIVDHYIQQKKYDLAIDVLMKMPKHEAKPMYYEFSFLFVKHVPERIIELWSSEEYLFLEPLRLMPALTKFQKRNEDLTMKYLRHITKFPHQRCRDQLVYDYFFSLLVKQSIGKSENIILSYLEERVNDKISMIIDLQRALRLSKQKRRKKTCIKLYSIIGLIDEAIDTALHNNFIEEAKELAAKVKNFDKRKELWFKIVEYFLVDKGDLEGGMSILSQCGGVLDVKSILPLMPKSIPIQRISGPLRFSLHHGKKETIQLQKKISMFHEKNLKSESALRNAYLNHLKQMVQVRRNTLQQQKWNCSICSICHKPAIVEGKRKRQHEGLFVYPCGHIIHQRCMGIDSGNNYCLLCGLGAEEEITLPFCDEEEDEDLKIDIPK